MRSKNHLKVFYDHQVFAVQRWGGVSRYFAELALRVSKTEAVSIHSPIYLSEYLAALPPGIVDGVRVPAFPGVRPMANTLARVSRPSCPFDIYHPTWYKTRGWRPPGSKVVHTVYDMIAELFPDDHHSYSRQAAAKKVAIEEADMVFCISQSTRADLIEMTNISPEKIAVTHLGSDIQLLRPTNPGVEYPYILFVGQRTGYKNFDSLLQAFKSSQRLRSNFGIICFGGGTFSKSEMTSIGKLFGYGHGTISHAQGNDMALAGAYRGAAVLVYPSKYEGFGIPVLEAMACACPVVATRVSSIPEVGGDAITYAAEPSAEAIRHALETLLFDNSMLRLAKARGLLRADLFSWESTATATLAGYRAIAGS